MNTLRIIITGGKDQYGAWAENVEGIYGAGDTLNQVKNNVREAIALYLECNEDAPEILKNNPTLEFVFDITGMIKYYSEFITMPAMERITGINQKQLWHYANGYKNPKKETAEKIEKALKAFAKQMEEEPVAV